VPAQVTSATPARPSGANVTVKELLDWLMPRLPENMKEQMSHAQVARLLLHVSLHAGHPARQLLLSLHAHRRPHSPLMGTM